MTYTQKDYFLSIRDDSEYLADLRRRLSDPSPRPSSRSSEYTIGLIVSAQKYDTDRNFDPSTPMEYVGEKTFKKLPESIQGQLVSNAARRARRFASEENIRQDAKYGVLGRLQDVQHAERKVEFAEGRTDLHPDVLAFLQEDVAKAVEAVNERITKRDTELAARAEAVAGERKYRRWYLETILEAAEEDEMIEAIETALSDLGVEESEPKA